VKAHSFKGLCGHVPAISPKSHSSGSLGNARARGESFNRHFDQAFVLFGAARRRASSNVFGTLGIVHGIQNIVGIAGNDQKPSALSIAKGIGLPPPTILFKYLQGARVCSWKLAKTLQNPAS
jgi:hypothetical protein